MPVALQQERYHICVPEGPRHVCANVPPEHETRHIEAVSTVLELATSICGTNPKSMANAKHRPSGPDFGRILIGKTSKSARPEFSRFTIRIRPNSRSEVRSPARCARPFRGARGGRPTPRDSKRPARTPQGPCEERHYGNLDILRGPPSRGRDGHDVAL